MTPKKTNKTDVENSTCKGQVCCEVSRRADRGYHAPLWD